MVTQEDLEGLDLMLWHGNGPRAAAILRCNQSTISRRAQRCLDAFGLRIKRREGEWTILGPSLLLQMEREIHQLSRLLGKDPLRLEGFPAYASVLLKPPPPGCRLGPQDAMSVQRPLILLKDRVIDAWLTDAADDLPETFEFPAQVWPLARQPISLSADPGHPLVGEKNVGFGDLLRFPLPIISAEGFPRSHAICAGLGLGTLEHAMRRYDPKSWEGWTSDAVTLTYSTPLHAHAVRGLLPIDAPPLFTNRIALVVRADVGEHARVQDLYCLLKARLLQLKTRYADFERLKLLEA